jgi:DNA segregation ATPase FtsK/SpoIIIE, S-DNA-T family
MQLFLTVVDTRSGDTADVVAEVDSGARVDVFAQSLERLLRDSAERSSTPAALYVDSRPLDPAATVGDSALRMGSLVGLDGPVSGSAVETAGLVELRVVGGPAAGTVFRLGVGSGELGSARRSWVCLADPSVPQIAAILDVDGSARCWIEPPPELVGAAAGGGAIAPARNVAVELELERGAGTSEIVDAQTLWTPGRQLRIGDSVLEVAPYTLPDAALVPSADGEGLDYNRPPRILPPKRQTRFRLPTPPKEPQRAPLPILMALLPLVGAVAMVLILHNTTFLLFALLSPLSMMGNFFNSRRNGRRSYAQLRREYLERKARVEADVEEAVDLELAERRVLCPDPAALAAIATGPRRRLWERRRHDSDHLVLRVGSAELPSEVVIEDPELDEHRRVGYRTLPTAPVTIPLPARGVLGVAGPGGVARALGRWLVIQAAVLHSPADLQIIVLTEAAGRESWDWLRWLPHSRPVDGQAAAVRVGTDADSAGRQVAQLLDLVGQRAKTRTDTGAAGFREPDVVVVLDGSRRLRSMPGVVQILREGPSVGVYAICLDTDDRLLPAECQAVVKAEQRGLVVTQADSDPVRAIRPDTVSAEWCARVARALAAIRDTSDEGDDAALPSASRLLEVLSLDPPRADAIVARWGLGGRSTAAVVGESYDGPFEIDLRRDGPHGLIAGTTGSGKSELLQTVVAALAVANRPDAMTFVLVDYKGGSAFADCVRLPHTVGMVTDLDEHLVSRALESLSAELRRREHMLAAAGAKDIEDYTRATDLDGRVSLPRLLIVIDEFASMVRDLPDFVTGLVNIAQRGRSLGIHLLLATQRPSGVVSPEIRANTNLRIALRVTDAAESQDVLNAADAARISKSTPGRAFVRLGHSSLVPFQAGRVGGRRPGRSDGLGRPPRVRPLNWDDLGRPIDLGPAPVGPVEDEQTDLRDLVEALREAAELAEVPAQRSPWLPALPDTLVLDDLPPVTWDGSHLAPIPYGLEDLPALQERRAAALDLARFGHLLAAGAPRSGRSQLLRAMAGSIARVHSSADVHLYGLDCGNGALLPLVDLPHCGAVVTRTQIERAVRLLRRLGEEVRRRQEVLATGGFADITEQRAAAGTDEERLPHLLLFIDRWEGFLSSLGELDAGTLIDQVFAFLREGASVGVHVVITGDRTLMSGRISTLTEDRIAFRMADRADYSLIGLRPRSMPEEIVPGRAFRSESGIELQTALLTADPSGSAQAAALSAIAAQAREWDADVPSSRRPFTLGELPSKITFAEAWNLREPGTGSGWALIGVGGDQLSALGPDLTSGVPAFMIGGPARSGRSTLLLSVIASYLARDEQVIVFAPRNSPLRSLAGRPGVIEVFTGADVTADEFTAALSKVTGPALIAADDAEALRDIGASPELRDVLKTGSENGIAMALAGNPEELSAGFSGWLVDARKARRGALLSPQNRTDGDLIGMRLPRTAVGQPVQPGRALLHLGDGQATPVQVPLP